MRSWAQLLISQLSSATPVVITKPTTLQSRISDTHLSENSCVVTRSRLLNPHSLEVHAHYNYSVGLHFSKDCANFFMSFGPHALECFCPTHQWPRVHLVGICFWEMGYTVRPRYRLLYKELQMCETALSSESRHISFYIQIKVKSSAHEGIPEHFPWNPSF